MVLSNLPFGYTSIRPATLAQRVPTFEAVQAALPSDTGLITADQQ